MVDENKHEARANHKKSLKDNGPGLNKPVVPCKLIAKSDVTTNNKVNKSYTKNNKVKQDEESERLKRLKVEEDKKMSEKRRVDIMKRLEDMRRKEDLIKKKMIDNDELFDKIIKNRGSVEMDSILKENGIEKMDSDLSMVQICQEWLMLDNVGLNKCEDERIKKVGDK